MKLNWLERWLKKVFGVDELVLLGLNQAVREAAEAQKVSEQHFGNLLRKYTELGNILVEIRELVRKPVGISRLG